ncbi:hypothetical protein BV22DRAFT_122825 [Leucogyrophana mollusca]|uniref:Uncharacterized protein n=1 Tax=Leucogyrophana mollusca TaxID=85980 RepID=A0ACB8BUI6_9AGAM|nr:hypothetical protein BV22DRAFT_122825 [Leucogyrophana mollusca]
MPKHFTQSRSVKGCSPSEIDKGPLVKRYSPSRGIQPLKSRIVSGRDRTVPFTRLSRSIADWEELRGEHDMCIDPRDTVHHLDRRGAPVQLNCGKFLPNSHNPGGAPRPREQYLFLLPPDASPTSVFAAATERDITPIAVRDTISDQVKLADSAMIPNLLLAATSHPDFINSPPSAVSDLSSPCKPPARSFCNPQ